MERRVNGINLPLGRYFGDGERISAYDGGLGMRMMRRTDRVFVFRDVHVLVHPQQIFFLGMIEHLTARARLVYVHFASQVPGLDGDIAPSRFHWAIRKPIFIHYCPQTSSPRNACQLLLMNIPNAEILVHLFRHQTCPLVGRACRLRPLLPADLVPLRNICIHHLLHLKDLSNVEILARWFRHKTCAVAGVGMLHTISSVLSVLPLLHTLGDNLTEVFISDSRSTGSFIR